MSRRLRALPAALLLVVTLASCGDDTVDSADPAEAPTTASPTPSEPAVAPGECAYLQDADVGKVAKPVALPPVKPEPVKRITFTTNLGPINAKLSPETAPCTVNSLVSLAKQGYYDNVKCHRLTTSGIFVLQCGDPLGSGEGGPGYRYDDELSGDEEYPAGTLAMANRSVINGHGTNGSQFFIVYKDTSLPPYYTVFGKVDVPSTKLVGQVAAKGTVPGSEAPAEDVILQSVLVD